MGGLGEGGGVKMIPKCFFQPKNWIFDAIETKLLVPVSPIMNTFFDVKWMTSSCTMYAKLLCKLKFG